jgi:hypothetical protein
MTYTMKLFAVALACFASITLHAQAPADSTNQSKELTPEQIDSLVKTIWVGQDLVIGVGSRENGWYKTMAFKSAFAWPIWLFRESQLQNNYTYTYDPDQIRTYDLVKDALTPGQELRVIKIRKRWNKTAGHYWHQLYLKDRSFGGVRFWCNIEESLKYKELIIP